MKLFITVALVQMGVSSAFALSAANPQSVCNRIDDVDYRVSCLQSAMGKQVDRYAAGECDSFTRGDDTMTCMGIIAGHTFQMETLRVCSEDQSAGDEMNCLSAIADQSFTSDQISACNNFSEASDTTRCFNDFRQAQPQSPAPDLTIKGSPLTWPYFDGVSRLVGASTGWIQLEDADKNYCSGRARLKQIKGDTLSEILNPSYELEIQGSWCQVIKIGYVKEGSHLVSTSRTLVFNLTKNSNGDAKHWAGYGGKYTIPVASFRDYSNGVSESQMSFILMTNSREDTLKPAYEKLTIDIAN